MLCGFYFWVCMYYNDIIVALILLPSPLMFSSLCSSFLYTFAFYHCFLTDAALFLLALCAYLTQPVGFQV